MASDRAQTTDPYTGRRATSINITRAIYLIFGLIEALLAIRFVLKGLGINADAGFAQLMYGLIAPLVAAFVGLFGMSQTSSRAVLGVQALIAFMIYALVAWLRFGATRSASVARIDTRPIVWEKTATTDRMGII